MISLKCTCENLMWFILLIIGRTNLISVVVALYNGERYLIPQLNSIYQQTLQPYEVLLDDCSTDLTYKITELFIKEHKLSINF